MRALKVGSLFSGIGGLDLAVESFFGAETVWHCEFDAEPSKVLAARWPGVPNFGDVTTVEWATVEPVDILCGGFPCQDLSLAGRRAGMRPGTRSGLWADFKTAIAALNPSVVVIENVRGLLSGCAESEADSEMGQCPRCADDSSGVRHAPNLRALGRVLGDLAGLGFDAEWGSLLASDVGAPHGRFRVFVLAYARGETREFWARFRTGEQGRVGRGRLNHEVRQDGLLVDRPLLRTPVADELGGGPLHPDVAKERGQTLRLSGQVLALGGHLGREGRLFSTPDTAPEAPNTGSNSHKAGNVVGLGNQVRSLLPTPVAQPSGNTPENHLRKKPGRSVVTDLAILVENDLMKTGGRLLPTPTASEGEKGGPGQKHGGGDAAIAGTVSAIATQWGEYEPAVRLWEAITRPAPAPTLPDGRDGNHRLAAVFPEWMMGYSAGWVTDILGRNPAIKACGNGVVPQQAFAALEIMWPRVLEAVAS